MLKWRIYYGDGSTFDSNDGSVYDAPGIDVQAVAYHTPDPQHSTGRIPIFRFDFYWWVPETEEWYGGELFGLFDYLVRPGPKKVIFGRTIDTATHQAIVNLACEDPDLERRPQ